MRAVSKAADRSWGGATILSLGDFVSRSSALAAVHYPEFGTLEVFAVDRNGVVNVIWRTPNADWNPPTALTPPAFASPGTPLVVVAYPLNRQLELFTTNKSDVLARPLEGPKQLVGTLPASARTSGDYPCTHPGTAYHARWTAYWQH